MELRKYAINMQIFGKISVPLCMLIAKDAIVIRDAIVSRCIFNHINKYLRIDIYCIDF